MLLLQRLKRIKWLLTSLFFLNVLFITTGVVLTVHYYQTQTRFDDHHNEILTANEQTSKLLDDLSIMMSQNKAPDKIAQAEWLIQLKNHPMYAKEAFMQETFINFNELSLKEFFSKHTEDFKNSCFDLIHRNLQALSLKKRSHDHLHTLLATSIGASLLVGIVLPLFLFFLAGKTIKLSYSLLQDSVQDWSKDWKENLESHGDEPFKNPMFWSNIGLSTVEVFSRHHSHPGFHILHDIVTIVKMEFAKSSDGKNKPDPNVSPIKPNEVI